jgi:hypothetical protein
MKNESVYTSEGGSIMPTKIEASPPVEPATSAEFFEAIAVGNSKAAADLLRRMVGLGPGDVQLLADLLSGDPVHAKLFPFVLKLVRRRRGRPSKDLLKKSDDQARAARAVERVHRKSGSVKLAVATVKEEQAKKGGAKWGRSKLFEARRAMRNIERRPSSPMTEEEQERRATEISEGQID